MRRRRRWLGIAGTVGMLVALSAAVFTRGAWVAHGAPGHALSHIAPAAPAVASASCARLGHWNIAPTPGFPNSVLYAVASVTGSDVWAVGQAEPGTLEQTLIENWNGSKWSVIASPNPGSYDALYGVAALSATDIWAVGYYQSSSDLTLIEHWDGTQWSVIASPNTSPNQNYLYAVSAVSANDVWAVGYYVSNATGSPEQTLTEHWNGTTWSVVPSFSVSGGESELLGVTAISTNDVWAVGFGAGTLIEHWNGTVWTAVPSLSGGNSGFAAVSAVSSSDVWAVGGDDYDESLTAHWNGTSWSLVGSPNPSLSGAPLQSVAAFSAHDVWAVGFSLDNNGNVLTLTEHWDGSAWSIATSANTADALDTLDGVAGFANDVWAVGSEQTNTGTLAEHYHSILQGAPGGTARGTSRRPGSAILCP
ncbi:MAG: hypothetical protein ACRDHP_20220 [Ktedonobacterales bacterium]